MHSLTRSRSAFTRERRSGLADLEGGDCGEERQYRSDDGRDGEAGANSVDGCAVDEFRPIAKYVSSSVSITETAGDDTKQHGPSDPRSKAETEGPHELMGRVDPTHF